MSETTCYMEEIGHSKKRKTNSDKKNTLFSL